LSSFFIIQIAFVFHNCIINIYVNITNSWFMQCFGGCFLCVSSHFTGEFSLKHTHWSHFWSVPAPRLWLMISTSFFLKRSLSTAHCISKNRGYLEEAGALRYRRISKGNSKILSLLICFVSVIWDDDHDHHYYYFSGWDHQPYLWKTMEKPTTIDGTPHRLSPEVGEHKVVQSVGLLWNLNQHNIYCMLVYVYCQCTMTIIHIVYHEHVHEYEC
jgi:hypothetical protein